MRQPDQDPPATLPADVCRVLELLATGLSAREVAARRGCPIHVVRAYLSRVITELGATSKLDAIVKAAQLGLIDLTGPPVSAPGSGLEAVNRATRSAIGSWDLELEARARRARVGHG